MATESKVRWGVLGCAGIAAKVCHGVAEAQNATVVAVASRSMDKARSFAEAHAAGAVAYDSYEALLADPSVQVVYIPLPTGMRVGWVQKAAAAKKHVLCEKPLAANFQDAAEAVQACRDHGVQFMDNTMFMHHTRLAEMKKIIASEDFGRVKHAVSCFTIPFGNDPDWASSSIRMSAATEPLGALGDLGWYSVRFSLWAFDWELPEHVSCHYFETTPDGVPITLHCVLRFSGGRSASFDASFKCSLRQWAEVVGERRKLSLDDLVVNQSLSNSSFAVTEGSIADRALTFPKAVNETHTQDECIQHAMLIEAMSGIVKSGSLDDSWCEVSLMTQRVLYACHVSGQRCGAWVKPTDV